MITIDGSLGEGGGQVLRTSLSLSMITGVPLLITNIRAKRRKPGLMRQHLTAVKAAAEIARARVDGDYAGSTELEFKPGRVAHGSREFAVGTAGSATLVLQTVLPALLATDGASRLVIEGGTHNPLAPPFDFLERAFLPLLRRMDAGAGCRLLRHGFFPAGGGKLLIEIEGGGLHPLSLAARGRETSATGVVLYSGLDSSIPKREAQTLARRLGLDEGRIAIREVESNGPGNVVIVDAVSRDGEADLTEVFTAFGERGVSSEKVASAAAREATEYIDHPDAAVGRHLADQLLLPMALAGGGDFTTLSPSSHTLTNMEVIHAFLPGRFSVEETGNEVFRIAYK